MIEESFFLVPHLILLTLHFHFCITLRAISSMSVCFIVTFSFLDYWCFGNSGLLSSCFDVEVCCFWGKKIKISFVLILFSIEKLEVVEFRILG